MKNGYGRERGGCVELGLETKENGSVQYRGSRCLAGAIVLDPLKSAAL